MTPRTQLRVQRGHLAQAVGQLYESSVAVREERAISSQYCVLLVVFICHVVEGLHSSLRFRTLSSLKLSWRPQSLEDYCIIIAKHHSLARVGVITQRDEFINEIRLLLNIYRETIL